MSTGLQDASADLLCALSQEERDLLEAVTLHGYTLHTAILALQRTGPKSPDQVKHTLHANTHINIHILSLIPSGSSPGFELPYVM